MSLARAFTTRRAKVFGGDGEGKPTRSLTVNRGNTGGTVRSKISAPMQLVSTTNMLSYNAPDIVRKGPKISAPVELTFTTNALSYDAPDIQKEPKTAASASSMSSFRSDLDSDHIHTAASSPPTSPDTAFPRGGNDDFVKSAPLEEANHLSCYFTLPGEPSTVGAPAVPSLPKRAASHTTRQREPLSPKTSMSERLNGKVSLSERMGRKPSLSAMSEHSNRSVSTKASGPFSTRVSTASTSTTASSQQSFGAHQTLKASSQAPPPVPAALSFPSNKGGDATAEPFVQELAQVTELAEEFATSAVEKTHRIATREESELSERGLHKFSPEEYVAEISNLITTFFGEQRHAKTPAPQWI